MVWLTDVNASSSREIQGAKDAVRLQPKGYVVWILSRTSSITVNKTTGGYSEPNPFICPIGGTWKPHTVP